MSGYNTRKIYDNCYTIEFIDQQVNPAKYRTLEEFAEVKGKCHSLNGPRANKARSTGELGVTSQAYRTDIESQLFNLDVPDSRCITLNTMREKDERLKRIASSNKVNYSTCNKTQDFTYSRLEIPVNDFRSVEINRYGFPIIDPKEFVYYGTPNTDQVNNQRFGVNTQLQAKDKVIKPNMNPTSNLTK
jgi:hypothetical protein